MPGVLQELQEIRSLAHEFALAELRPHTERWDHERGLDDTVLAQIAELGFFGMIVPEQFGGMGFDHAAYCAVLEQLAWGEAGAALLVAQSALAADALQHGTDAQKQQWLEPLARGEATACFALAEPEAGSDLSGIQSEARREDGQWVLNAHKAWVTNATRAQLAFVLARTGSEPAIFLVGRGPGWQVLEREHTLGLRSLEICQLRLQQVRVPEDACWIRSSLGREPSAPAGALGRLSIAAISVGIARAALDHARAYADQREQFGTSLRQFEGIQFKLADMITRTNAASALLDQASASDDPALAAMAKIFASESALWVATQAVQIFGGYGYMRDYPVEKLMRDAKAMELLEGANELQRVFIARALYE